MSIRCKIGSMLMLSLLLTGVIWVPSPGDGASSSGNPEAVIETNKGTIRLELFEDDAPITVENFKRYANDGFYQGLIFHRVIERFMIQGGGFNTEMESVQASYPSIENEAEKSGHRNKRGTVAMARSKGAADSATSQFFINQADNRHSLDWDTAKDSIGYCVFGEVIDGMDVVDDIASMETHTENGYEDVPMNDVIMQSVTMNEDDSSQNDNGGSGGGSDGEDLTDSSSSSSSESSPFYTDILFIEAVISAITAVVIILFIKSKKEEDDDK